MFVKYILDAKSLRLVTVSPGNTVRDVGALFKEKKIGFALVQSRDNIMLGTVSERDIIHALAERDEIGDLPVVEIMTTKVVKCQVNDTLRSVRQAMTNQRTRHIVVLDGDDTVGVISIGDVVKHSLDECRIDTDHMVEYINGVGYQ